MQQQIHGFAQVNIKILNATHTDTYMDFCLNKAVCLFEQSSLLKDVLKQNESWIKSGQKVDGSNSGRWGGMQELIKFIKCTGPRHKFICN